MTNSDTYNPKEADKPGPLEDRLKIDGDWEEAVDKALKKDRPKDGWPKPDPKKNG